MASQEPIVRMEGIHRYFGPVRALQGVNLRLHRREVLGLVGDNGAGKSTLMKVLSGVYQPDQGQVYLEGQATRFHSPRDSRAAGVEMVYQDLALAGNLDVTGNIFLGQELTGRRCDEVAIITGHMTAQSIADRVNGSKEAFTACGVEVVAELNGEHTREGGQAVMEDIITANPNVKAVFCANDNMALGAVEALKAAGKLEDVIVAGFDANPDAAASILAGEMTASIAQSPYNMGRFGVVYGLAAIQGNEIPELIDTGTTLVTADNAADYTD